MTKQNLIILIWVWITAISGAGYYYYNNYYLPEKQLTNQTQQKKQLVEKQKQEKLIKEKKEKEKKILDFAKKYNDWIEKRFAILEKQWWKDILDKKFWKKPKVVYYYLKPSEKLKQTFSKEYWNLATSYLERWLKDDIKNNTMEFKYKWKRIKVYFNNNNKIKKIVTFKNVKNDNYLKDLKDSFITKQLLTYNKILKMSSKLDKITDKKEQEKLIKQLTDNKKHVLNDNSFIMEEALRTYFKNSKHFKDRIEDLKRQFNDEKEQLKTKTIEVPLNIKEKDFLKLLENLWKK